MLNKYKSSTRIGQNIKPKTLKQMYKTLIKQEHPYLALPRIPILPSKRLCDFTGLPAQYTCPRTKLRFYDLSIYKYLRELGSEHSEKYYKMRYYGETLLAYKK
ncbi:INO80 complex subunit C [Enteropsectra breve]|nr:INO80 complex subunit C [Enteropsectra breve]